MIQDYISRQVLARNRSVYFRQGKWAVHVLCVIIFWLYTYSEMDGAGTGELRPHPALTAVMALIGIAPFVAFFCFYCLYLIPVCFKQNRYRQFWALLLALLLVMPWVDEGVQTMLRFARPEPDGRVAALAGPGRVFRIYQDFVAGFLGFTCILFLMELVEGIRTGKQMSMDSAELARTEAQLLKMRMNPAFVHHSLEAIIQLSETGSPAAPDAVLHFADVLRYRLYCSGRQQVPLAEELLQLRHLFLLQQAMPAAAATLDIEGEIPEATLPPLLLINIAEPLLTGYSAGGSRSLHCYVLVEDAGLQIAIEITDPDHCLAARQIDSVREDMKRAMSTATFSQQPFQDNHSIRICIPLQTPSAVLS